MAVEASSRRCRILKNSHLAEGGQLALVNPHFPIYLISWWYTAVCESPFLKAVATHLNLEILVLDPFTIVFHAYGKRECSPLVLRGQLMPFVNIEVGILAIDMQLATFFATHHHVHSLVFPITIEIERSNLCWDGDTCIVGEYGRQLLHDRGILRHRATRHHHPRCQANHHAPGQKVIVLSRSHVNKSPSFVAFLSSPCPLGSPTYTTRRCWPAAASTAKDRSGSSYRD